MMQKSLGTVLLSLLMWGCGESNQDSSVTYDMADEVIQDTGVAIDAGLNDDASSGYDAGTASDSSVTEPPDLGPKPLVTTAPTYEGAIEVTTETYGRGQVHTSWMGPVDVNSRHDDVNDGIIDLKLDVYEPVEAPGNRPAVLIIHGGGFSGGTRDKASYVEFANFFAARGFVAVSMSYRLVKHKGTVPESWLRLFDDVEDPGSRNQGLAMYPAARDAKAALRWLHANAARYQINPSHIATIGGSAGSHLAIMLGVTDASDFRDELTAEDDPTLTSTHLDADARVATIINHWGSKILMDGLTSIDGINRFDETDAPLSIFHGLADDVVLPVEGEKLEAEYIRTGVPHQAYYHPTAGHGAWGASVRTDDMEQSLQVFAFEFIIEQQGLRVAP